MKNLRIWRGWGGLQVSGRWQSKGRPVIYCAEHPALAPLEVRAHMDLEEAFLGQFVIMKITLPDAMQVQRIDDSPEDESQSQQWGDAWLTAADTAVCRVRSVLYVECYNYLVTPSHPDAQQIELISVSPIAFDERLFQ